MGDPAGVGPEICLQALSNNALKKDCIPVIFGDLTILNQCAKRIGLAPVSNEIDLSMIASISDPAVVHIPILKSDDFQSGIVNSNTGKAAYEYIQKAIDAALRNEVNAVTTAPVHKHALRQAQIPFHGHTEIFAHRSRSKRWCMMQYSEKITCSFVTLHVGHKEVPDLLSRERILDVIRLSAKALQTIRGRKPKIVVCGLNPHAGEHGLFGNREEERIIFPAVEDAKKEGFDVEGPLPPDTAFIPNRRCLTDVFVCMFHDQGHIPLKALAFDEAVNTTLGLPIVRTSVAHGTALDLAWKGKANPSSLFHAIKLAARLSSEKSRS